MEQNNSSENVFVLFHICNQSRP